MSLTDLIEGAGEPPMTDLMGEAEFTDHTDLIGEAEGVLDDELEREPNPDLAWLGTLTGELFAQAWYERVVKTGL